MVAVGDETQRQREPGEHQRPGVQVGDRAAAREADPGHAMMEVLAVGAVDGLLVLEPLQHHEGRVQERHGEQDQRQHQRDHGLGLDRRLDRDHAHQQAEQVRAAVAHEARGRREVPDQEAERGAGRDRGQHARRLTAEVEGDHGHRAGDDRADARREAVDAVGEVDDVHHQHEAEHGEDRAPVRDARVREVEFADERQRDHLHGHAVVDDDRRREHLPEQLQRGVQVKAVIDRADERDHRRADQHAVPEMRGLAVAGRQEGQHPDHRAGEDRDPSEQRRRPL